MDKISPHLASFTSEFIMSRGHGKNFSQGGVSVVVLLCDFDLSVVREVWRVVLSKILVNSPEAKEIILVVNSLSSDSVEELKRIVGVDSRVVIIGSPSNLGVVAKNFGYLFASGEFICSVDSDVIVQRDWISKLLEGMKDPNIGLCGPCGGRLHPSYWTDKRWGCDGATGTAYGYENPQFFGDPTPTGTDGTALDVVPSMCWIFRRAVLSKVGFLDWRFGPFVGSDSDFCLKVKEGGWKVTLRRVPVWHLLGGGQSHPLHDFDLKELRDDHISALYQKWFPRAATVCEMYKPKK